MRPLPIFNDWLVGAPTTEGIKYAGSKLKILPYILQMVRHVGAKTVLDGFSGTTRVSQALAKTGCDVICNDLAVWSEVFGTCYLLNEKPAEHYAPIIQHLNSLPPVDGWFTEHYGGHPNKGCAIQSDGSKKPWQIHNTRKLDAIRQEIERLDIDSVDKAVLLTSLMLALDRVDNTLGHFASYLKDWSPRSYDHMHLKIPAMFPSTGHHRVSRQDIFDLLPELNVDLAYYDPPYGSNNEKMPPSRVRYSAYYHVWQSVCLYDEPPVFGRAMRRQDTSDRATGSVFEDFRRSENDKFVAVEAIENLIRDTQAKWVILSYSSGGRATAQELDSILRANGELTKVVSIDYYKNVMANMTWVNQWISESEQPNREFVFLLKK